MIRCDYKNGTNQVKVTFSPADGLDGDLAVVGDFNGWDPHATPMRKRGAKRTASVIVASVVVESGKRYAFRYLRGDGQWLNDEGADAYEMGDRGEANGVIDLTDAALVGGPGAR